MKILKKLEKSKAFWSLIIICIVFFLLRIPSLIEPNWYGDEGIYQVIGQALSKGRLLYLQIWDNKPPLLYIVYALFHGDQYSVRLFSLIVGLFTTGLFFYLSRTLFKKLKASIISTLFFALIFATPFWEGNIANAENFILLPIIGAAIIIYKYSQDKKYKILNAKYSVLLVAGLLLGIAFLFKIVAVFDFAALFIFLLISSYKERFSLERIKTYLIDSLRFILPFILGFMIPLIITSLYFVIHHAFKEFTRAVFFSNVGYVGYGNNLLIPQGLLILKLLLLVTVICFVFWKRKNISKPALLISLWLSFSLFNTYFSGRPYTHYTLVTLPSLSLLIGLFLTEKEKIKQFVFLGIFFFSIILLNHTFKFNLNRTFAYYGNTFSFLTGHKNTKAYQAFFDVKTPRDYELAAFIKAHTTPEDNVFVWGNSAQIYALSGKLPPGKYTVAYHITESAFRSTQVDINNSKPKYIVALSDTQPLPFYLPTYSSRFVFNEATIYERSN